METITHIERSVSNTDWIFIVLFACLGIVAVVRYYYHDSFSSFIQLPLSNKYFLIAGKGFSLSHPFTLLLLVVNLTATSLFIVLVLHYLINPELTVGLALFFQVFGAVLGFVVVRLIVDKLIGITFGIESTVDQYIFERITYQNLIALFLGIATIAFMWLFKSQTLILYIAMGIVLLAYLISLFYSFKTNEKVIFTNFFYFILYLCALEISPYILVYKVLV